MTVAPGRIMKHDPHGPVTGQRLRLIELTEPAHASVGRSSQPLAPIPQFQPLHVSADRSTVTATPPQPNAAETRPETHTALRAVIDELQRQHDVWLDHFQQETVRLAIAIAERLLRRTLSIQPDSVTSLIQQALEASGDVTTIPLRMHPSDVDLLESNPDALPRDMATRVELIRDPNLSRGDCVAEFPGGTVDARLTTLLDRIAAELLDEVE